MNITPIPTKLMSDTTADGISDEMVEAAIEADLPIQPIGFYFDKCAAIIAGVDNGTD